MELRLGRSLIPYDISICKVLSQVSRTSAIKRMTRRIRKFRDARNWKQFHNPKDIALSMMLEAGEVAEHFQWMSREEIERYAREHREEIGEELSDVLYWVLLLSYDLKIDLEKAFER